MNFGLTAPANNNPQFPCKLNMNNHFMTQSTATRFNYLQNLNTLNNNNLLSVATSTGSTINGQIKSNNLLKVNSLNVPQHHSSISSFLLGDNQRSSNASNLVNSVSLNNFAAQREKSIQKANTQSLIASVVAANTSCNLNNTLFVGNLHASLQEIDLVQVFRPFGQIVECCKKWLHFGFVKFTSEEEACHAYVTLNGFRLKGRPMRLEFQNRTKKVFLK